MHVVLCLDLTLDFCFVKSLFAADLLFVLRNWYLRKEFVERQCNRTSYQEREKEHLDREHSFK